MIKNTLCCSLSFGARSRWVIVKLRHFICCQFTIILYEQAVACAGNSCYKFPPPAPHFANWWQLQYYSSPNITYVAVMSNVTTYSCYCSCWQSASMLFFHLFTPLSSCWHLNGRRDGVDKGGFSCHYSKVSKAFSKSPPHNNSLANTTLTFSQPRGGKHHLPTFISGQGGILRFSVH